MTIRFLPTGEDGLLIELPGLEPALALYDHLQTDPPAGLVEAVPAARTVLLRFDALTTSAARLADHVRTLDLTPGPPRSGQVFDIPVTYDGEDLGWVADHLGWTVEELIARHTQAEFTVAFTGFAPGFAYMTCSDPAFDIPRRSSPRVRIPAGSVALAGRFGGIYPTDSPGGWQLLGRTDVPMWDLSRPRPALLAPGDRVRFQVATSSPRPLPRTPVAQVIGAAGLTITRTDRPVLVQDLGRPGQAAQGVARSGALDRAALRRVNRLLGNAPGDPALEVTFGGLSLRADAPVTLAVTGAPCGMTLHPADGGAAIPIVANQPFAMDAGDRLDISTPTDGMISYLGVRGGIAVERTLGSAARDILAQIGPEPILSGARILLADNPARPVTTQAVAALPRAGEVVTLDIILGPRDDWFTDDGVRRLTDQDWLVTPEVSRTGKRLSAPQPLERRDAAELASEPTVPGAIQVPHNGQPVLFLADHPLTGGYPVIACVAAHHLDLSAQVPPGGRLRFRVITPKDLT